MTIPRRLMEAGCGTPEIALLQPADPFLDTAGEDLRRRIFLTRETGGKLFCLRPEFTIPVCLHHVSTGAPAGRYTYSGSVFRQRGGGDHEFTQAGFENLGASDKAGADLEAIQLAVSAVAPATSGSLLLTLGNQALFEGLVDALAIPTAWRKRLSRFFGSSELLRIAMDAMGDGTQGTVSDGDLRAALDARNIESVQSHIAKQMADDGLPVTSGRTAEAIAARLMEKHELASMSLSVTQRGALDDFLQIEVPLAKTGAAIAEFEARHGIDLGEAGQTVTNLAEALTRGAAMGGLGDARFRAGFGRRLDYYTGLVFELHRSGENDPVAGGGRYDRLLQLLGAPREVPAVGFAIWTGRLEGGR